MSRAEGHAYDALRQVGWIDEHDQLYGLAMRTGVVESDRRVYVVEEPETPEQFADGVAAAVSPAEESVEEPETPEQFADGVAAAVSPAEESVEEPETPEQFADGVAAAVSPAEESEPRHETLNTKETTMELTFSDIRELLAGSGDRPDPLDPKPGDCLLIRTVTMTITGRVAACSPTWLLLDQAAWIADTGRFSEAISAGSLNEVEPMGSGVRVARGAIVDVTPWKHDLPTNTK